MKNKQKDAPKKLNDLPVDLPPDKKGNIGSRDIHGKDDVKGERGSMTIPNKKPGESR
jgi:hypothetical protein